MKIEEVAEEYIKFDDNTNTLIKEAIRQFSRLCLDSTYNVFDMSDYHKMKRFLSDMEDIYFKNLEGN